MRAQTFSLISGVIFALIAIAHAVRLAMGWNILVGTWLIPFWVSAVGLIVSGLLAYYGLRFAALSAEPHYTKGNI